MSQYPYLVGLALVLLATIVVLRMHRPKRDYRVQFHGRAGITYSDPRGVVEVDGEMLVGRYSYVLYPDRMKLTKPGTQNHLDDDWRAEIISRVEASVGKGRLDVA